MENVQNVSPFIYLFGDNLKVGQQFQSAKNKVYTFSNANRGREKQCKRCAAELKRRKMIFKILALVNLLKRRDEYYQLVVLAQQSHKFSRNIMFSAAAVNGGAKSV